MLPWMHVSVLPIPTSFLSLSARKTVGILCHVRGSDSANAHIKDRVTGGFTILVMSMFFLSGHCLILFQMVQEYQYFKKCYI